MRRASTYSVRERLELFCDVVDDVRNRRGIRDGTVEAKWSVSYHEDSGSTTSSSQGDEEDVRSLATAIRKLHAQKKPTNFRGVSALLEQRLQDEELRSHARENLEGWSEAEAGTFKLIFNGRPVGGSAAFDYMVNGVWLHSDADDRAALRAMNALAPGLVATAATGFMHQALRAAWPQRNVVRAALQAGTIRLDTSDPIGHPGCAPHGAE